ncbi:MAG: hypothetical protein M9897_02340 [Brumimicrobium sp.]|nr:hypothetical protein [Brumimicrobium sp.]
MAKRIVFAGIGLAVVIVFLACGSSKETAGVHVKQISYKNFEDFQDKPFMFYNVENLFDTINDPAKNDDEFTPQGANLWNSKRYYDKLEKLASVLTFPSKNNPVFVGFAEVETKAVVEDLMKTGRLKSSPYKVVHFESPDERGIDVAFAYNSACFKVEYQEGIRYVLKGEPGFKTRNILYVKGGFKDSTIVHIFVNHWPSRRGGEEQSEYRRIAAAQLLKRKTDSILAIEKDARIFIMGDFNDYPTNRSIIEVLDAGMPDGKQSFVNLMLIPHKNGIGSYNYKGYWGMLDQFIVTPNFINTTQGLAIKGNTMFLVDDDRFMHFNDNGKFPSKTYGGHKYYGGYSDHLSVYGYFEKR